ncbi:TPA: hypothetical protein TVN89_001800 [Streptococcus equi subsp. zooepidemicus]|nr:hypothetical protein [Streptococcus equi subsp. zooepidemicus]
MADLSTIDKVFELIADFSLDITHVGQGDFSSDYKIYSCTLTYGEKSIPVKYEAHQSQGEPTVMDIVTAVAHEAQSYDNYRSIDEFASEFGYNTTDTPVSKIIGVFNGCKESYEWLCSNEGRPLYSHDLPQLTEMLNEHEEEITKKVNALLAEKAATEAYLNPPVPEGFVSLKKIMNDLDLGDYGDRITEHDVENYIGDAFTSIADDAVDIYHSSLMSWLSDNYGWLEDAADEGLLEGIEDGDLIKMAQIAQFVCYERDLYDHQDDILSYYVTSELHDDGLYMVDEELAEELSNMGKHFERLDSALDAAKDKIRYALVASFEELYGEEYGEDLAEEMADKVIDENYTIVNPCVMNLSTVHEVNEKGYEQAFDNQWKDYLRQAHIDNLTAIFKQDGQALENFFNLNDWENLPTIDTFQEWYTNDFSQINEASFADDPDGLTNAQNEALARLDNSLFNPKNRWSSTLSTHDTDKDTMTVSSDSSHNYRLLSRLQLDCEYYLGACVENQVDMATAQKHLWAGTIEGQIDKMRELYKSLPEKPEWLSSSDIDQYEKKMLSARDGNKNIRLSSISKDMSASSNEIKEHNAPDTNRTDRPER